VLQHDEVQYKTISIAFIIIIKGRNQLLQDYTQQQLFNLAHHSSKNAQIVRNGSFVPSISVLSKQCIIIISL
jgi:hypothetical protein